jgi:hypothetical protein
MSNPAETQKSIRPGLKVGRSNEFTLMFNLKPGGAERMRKKMDDTFDNDTRLLFASTFDGDWDQYINDFATIIPDEIDLQFGEVDGYPGIHSPDIKDFIVKHQVQALYFYSAYPNASVRDVWKALKVKGGLDVILDSATS